MKQRDHTGNYDQRFIPRADHDAARRWFFDTVKKEHRWKWEERAANIHRLREMIDYALDRIKEKK